MRLRFDDYMDRCLYDPEHGFYAAARGVAGRRRGDFITSPEVGPLFGAVLARALDTWWDELGRPDPFLVVDAGAGPGALLRSLELAAPRCADSWRLIGVDPNGRDGVVPQLPPDLDGAVVIANELLDNLPFRIVERREHAWAEVFVDVDEAGLAVEHVAEVDISPPFDGPVGHRAPWLERAGHWLDDVLQRGASKLVVFDYGAETTEELARRGGWLRTYRAHERGDDPLNEPGAWDITTDLPVDQLPPPASVTRQAEFLRQHGIHELVDEGRRYWHDHAAAPDLQAMRMRSRISESEALLDPGGLGGWLVLQW